MSKKLKIIPKCQTKPCKCDILDNFRDNFEIAKMQHFEFVSKSNQEKQNFQMKLDEAKRQNVKLQNQIIDLTNNTPSNKLNYDTIVKLRVKNDKLIIACCVLSVALFCCLVYIAI